VGVFTEFLRSLLGTWVEKVGIVLTIIPFIEKIPRVRRRLEEKPLLDRFVSLLWVIGAICIFWGFFAAWSEQYEKRQAAEQALGDLTKTQFSCQIDQAFTPRHVDSSFPKSLVIMVVFVKNIGAPSSAEGYTLKAELMDKTVLTGNLKTIPQSLPVVFPNGFTRNISSHQALYSKTASPLGHNSFTRGYLIFEFDTSDERLASSASRWILSFVDINGTPTMCSQSPAFQGGPNTDLSFPGLDE
jgi:hypothetical protein